jgi:hypothetical protein
MTSFVLGMNSKDSFLTEKRIEAITREGEIP